MNLVSTLGIDLAKNTFAWHGVNSNGPVVLRRTASRSRLAELVTQLLGASSAWRPALERTNGHDVLRSIHSLRWCSKRLPAKRAQRQSPPGSWRHDMRAHGHKRLNYTRVMSQLKKRDSGGP
jgi:hypothetical protein